MKEITLYKSFDGFRELKVKVGKDGVWIIYEWNFGKEREEIFLEREHAEKLLEILKDEFW